MWISAFSPLSIREFDVDKPVDVHPQVIHNSTFFKVIHTQSTVYPQEIHRNLGSCPHPLWIEIY